MGRDVLPVLNVGLPGWGLLALVPNHGFRRSPARPICRAKLAAYRGHYTFSYLSRAGCGGHSSREETGGEATADTSTETE